MSDKLQETPTAAPIALAYQTNIEDTTKDKFLTFIIDDEEYGVEIAKIREIISICKITKVPESPDYVEGIINLRGDIVPVINVRRRFSKPWKEYDALTCIVVIEYNTYKIGLIVDSVNEVAYIQEENILPPPSSKINYYNQFIRNIGRVEEDVKLLLDLDRLLAN
ncbi:MAG: chemotaxis protein CheW [Defluviitaleaceae bacterium]|nr:chemotaxis protein CheW [Defluviitaleaceae bacterium]